MSATKLAELQELRARLRSLEQELGRSAHALNNLITVIIGNLELAAEADEDFVPDALSAALEAANVVRQQRTLLQAAATRAPAREPAPRVEPPTH